MYFRFVALMAILLYTQSANADHTWNNYHWARTTEQFTLKLGNNLTNGWDQHLTQASADWNDPAAAGANFTPVLTYIIPGQSNKRCAPIKGTTQVCNGTYGKNGWLGLATISISGSHITQGTAKMNDTYFNTSKYNNPNEKLHVMCQEIAHTFGLGHQSEDGSSQDSCMDYFSNTGVNATSTLSTKPNFHDFEELISIYSHLDTITTLMATPVEAARPSNWGRLTHQSANGQSSTYEKAHPNGSKTITHVYWTEEKAAQCKHCDHRFE